MSALFRKKIVRPRVAAVVAAGGSSSRMGCDKLLAELDGQPVLVHTLFALEECPAVDEMILVAREERIPELLALARDCGLTKLRTIVKGGETRQQSVYNGVCAASPEAEFLCVHDAARPLVTRAVIERAIAAAVRYGAATAAIPLKDTVKLASPSGMVTSTPPREAMMAVQTPQAFSRALYLRAYLAADREYSDDCQLIEALGEPVALSEGDRCNLKLTTPEDLIVAEALLQWEGSR